MTKPKHIHGKNTIAVCSVTAKALEGIIVFTLHRFMKNFPWSWNALRTFKTISKWFSAQHPKTDVVP